MMELRGLNKSYGENHAIADLSLEIRDNEYLTLLGPSGSGKSTLLRLIAGLEPPDTGSITLDGQPITAEPTYMRGLGFVQQNYALFPHMSVENNVSFGLRNRQSNRITDEAEVTRRTRDILSLVGLTELGGRMVGQISGGQKQRVSLARTLVTEPRICLLDEPLGALDANLRERMTVELRRIRAALDVTFLHVTGNETEAMAMGDRLIVLDQGRTIQIADPDTVYNRPETVRVARFINAYNVLSGEMRDRRFVHRDVPLDVPVGADDAAFYAIRFDATTVLPQDTHAGEGFTTMPATFIASEFMGSEVTYFFHGPDGAIFEVIRHLSRSDPETYTTGEARQLAWPVEGALLFDSTGRRIDPAPAREAA
ncbi:MAG: ABC transporter ATP-binding protein [Hyphomicrobiales bacterium]|nr:ABC transporter ATP-binding protein [Hyphomicrobiales bacterium]